MRISAELHDPSPGRAVLSPAYQQVDENGAIESPPRVLMVSARYYPEIGGIETHIHEVAWRLARRGAEVTVLTTNRGQRLPAREVTAGVVVERVPAWPEARDYYFAPDMFGRIRSGSWNVVHVQGCHTLVAPMAMAAAITGRVPFLITFHSGGHSSRLRQAIRKAQWQLLGPLVRRAACCVAVSEFEREYFRDAMHLSEDKLAVVANGAEMVADTAAETREPCLIVSIGRLERYKGHHRVIAAFPEVLRHRPEARLRILGGGPYAVELSRLVDRLGLKGHVRIEGIPSSRRGELGGLLKSAALVVLLSEYEAHPVAVMEALALGRRVIATNGTGFSELVDRGLIRGVPMDAGSPEVAGAILDELSSESSPSKVVLPGWDQCADELLRLYLRTARPRSTAAATLSPNAPSPLPKGPDRPTPPSARRGPGLAAERR